LLAYKPSIRYEQPEQAEGEPLASDSGARQPSALPNHEVMELDLGPATGPDPPTWRVPYLDYLLREALSTDKMEAQRLACRAPRGSRAPTCDRKREKLSAVASTKT
jgi:hypothetical protein